MHELPQPDWVHSVWDQHSGETAFDLIVELKRVSRLEEFNSPKKSRLRAGFLLADIFNRMTAKTIRNDASKHDFVLYSSVITGFSELKLNWNIWKQNAVIAKFLKYLHFFSTTQL